MKRFITGLFVFAIALVLVVFVLNRNYYPAKAKGNDGYMGSMVDKHAYADKHPSPRIIFCGGSNIAFGINSKRIQDSTGMPVVNLGTTGSLGLNFMLNEAKYTARPTDIVIISTEYYLTVDGIYKAHKEAQRIYPPAGKFFRQTVKQSLNDFFIEDLQKNLTVTLSSLLHIKRKGFPANVVYSRTSFNEQGDVVRNFEPHPSHAFLNNFEMKRTAIPGIDLFNAFKQYTDEHSIQVYFIYPAFPQSLYEPNAATLTDYDRDLHNGITIKILNKPQNVVYADSLFYDTEYHLIPKGREMRTDKIIALLRQEGVGKFKQDH